MHIYSICKMKRVRFSVHGVQLNKVITQRVVIFSSPDMKDAHDHRPILNTVTRFSSTASSTVTQEQKRWMMGDCLAIKR